MTTPTDIERAAMQAIKKIQRKVTRVCQKAPVGSPERCLALEIDKIIQALNKEQGE